MVEMEIEGTTLEAVIAIAQRGDGVLLKKAGQPVAQVNFVPSGASTRRAPLHAGIWEVNEDFDASLSR